MIKRFSVIFISIVFMMISAASAKPVTAKPQDKPAAPAATQPAQSNTAARGPRSHGITGRVIDQNNAPLENAMVSSVPLGITDPTQTMAMLARLRPTSSDENGRFIINNLPAGAYSLTAIMPGYVVVPEDSDERQASEQKYYWPGDTADIRMIKGGVITGTVTTMTGEPLIGIKVSVIPLRDLKGRPIHMDTSRTQQLDYHTDDRGVYRIYGLRPGTYVISAGSRSSLPTATTAYDNDAPTYHPSSARDTAQEVTVHSGEELSAIDIRYREFSGHAISGTVTGEAPDSKGIMGLKLNVISLSELNSRAFLGLSITPPMQSQSGFHFDGVSDGDYVVVAVSADASAASRPRRVTIKGEDAGGIELVMVPFASIEGKIVMEPLPKTERKTDCQPGRPALFEEIILAPRVDNRVSKPTGDKEQSSAEQLKGFNPLASSTDTAPNSKGEFNIKRLETGRQHINVRFPDDGWYARSMKLPPLAPSTELRDAVRNGIAVKPGEKVQGLTVTLTEGAAAVRGHILPTTEGVQLPAQLRVYLVPAEKEAADEVLRYYEADVKGDGFELKNLAPGRYFIITRRAADDPASEESPLPVAWDNDARQRLHQRAETANTVLDLQPCQRRLDYLLKVASTAKKKPEDSKPH